METLVQSVKTGSVKVRWNACYAIGNILRNVEVQKVLPDASWCSTVFPNLVSVIRDGKNFKIRINAAASLAIPPLRKHFGLFYGAILHVLVESLETIDEKMDFAEFKYKETLQDQVHHRKFVTNSRNFHFRDELTFL